jgi:hypothetical protein
MISLAERLATGLKAAATAVGRALASAGFIPAQDRLIDVASLSD